MKSLKPVFAAAILVILPSIWAARGSPSQSFAEQSSDEMARRGADVANADYFAEIEFDRGSKALGAVEREKIKKILDDSRKSGTISMVSVLSWADEEFPSDKRKNLSDDQKALADQRNTVLKEIVNALQSAPVTTYSMAEQSDGLQMFLHTDDARLKRSLVAAGLPTNGDKLRFPSKASHGLVFIHAK